MATTTKKKTAKKPTRKTGAKKVAKKAAAKKVAMKVRPDDATLIAKIEANARAAGVKLPPGASAAAIEALEKTLGLELPEEVKAWYRVHDGGGDAYVLENRELLSVKYIAGQWKIWKDLLDQGVFGANDHGEPGPGVQKKWWIPEWVPVTYDGAGNHDVVDLAPGKGGTRGQILSFWHDEPSRRVVGRDFLSWLAEREWGVE